LGSRFVRADQARDAARRALVFQSVHVRLRRARHLRRRQVPQLKIDKTDDANFKQAITHGWVAALQHHFASAIVPPADAAYQYSLSANGHQYLATVVGPMRSVAPQTAASFKETLYIGPKLQRQLDEIHPELSRVADYGTLTFLSKPLFSCWSTSTRSSATGAWRSS
jgi:YidC/Oxa1 family membrane protein insertase